MESSAARRFEKVEPKVGFELKTIVLTSACFIYAIVIFLTAACISKAVASTMSSASLTLKRYQFWSIDHQTTLDMKPTRARSTKHIYQG
ncbi:hypothetical protein KP79_PYT06857 [Mizuhopecten yessoensis]|uniref:Uncharacterized protein n=1 Tax=Mizuhopecten yessoensis TaxID=6573 RepID=A0A210QUT9_MIZYE|nr:hypothetical protein KP79_PYT03376 [Mizuhopecten yessoensis]OWF52485.1 hypothetical protein KP79_PYT06857 [Mizuhopecten yessoensis]